MKGADVKSTVRNSKAVENIFAQFMPKILCKVMPMVFTQKSLIIANQILGQSVTILSIKPSKEVSNVIVTLSGLLC